MSDPSFFPSAYLRVLDISTSVFSVLSVVGNRYAVVVVAVTSSRLSLWPPVFAALRRDKL